MGRLFWPPRRHTKSSSVELNVSYLALLFNSPTGSRTREQLPGDRLPNDPEQQKFWVSGLQNLAPVIEAVTGDQEFPDFKINL